MKTQVWNKLLTTAELTYGELKQVLRAPGEVCCAVDNAYTTFYIKIIKSDMLDAIATYGVADSEASGFFVRGSSEHKYISPSH